ncbi:hypothetical protein LTR53_012273 [Teratosphaeriaceae sp. CCFEE 6253]|nr:hypothetical protein LTR53_012273 [Teratosphaeriaceae sp. CCFEE 6253]
MASVAQTDQRRLHITPFSRELLDRFIAPSLQPFASGISFHTVETFPERGFGYVELPVVEAEKLKKKLNGMTLKGAKVRIEEAKPEKKRRADVETEEERQTRKRAKKEKRKQEDGVIAGHELIEGRRVKRGWTGEGSEKKRDKKGKRAQVAKDDGHGDKLRFRTTVPPNMEPVDAKTQQKSESRQDKKHKRGNKPKRKTVVQEYSKDQKPSVDVRGSLVGNRVAGFEHGEGWVDESGNIIEAGPVLTRSKRERQPVPAGVQEPPTILTADSSGTLDIESEEEVSSVVSDDTSSQAAEPDSESKVELDGQDTTVLESSSNLAGPSEKEPETPEVHPLEALFKRAAPKPESATKPKPSPIDTSFSFFTSGATEETDHDATAHPPQTPHTKEDLEWRSVRSAAPTPDTAAIGKRFQFPPPQGDDEEDDENQDEDVHVEEVMEDVSRGDAITSEAITGANGGKEESAFRKWFYDNRGELNRSWKKRRRDERKQKRQRENKRMSRRVA